MSRNAALVEKSIATGVERQVVNSLDRLSLADRERARGTVVLGVVQHFASGRISVFERSEQA